MRSAKNKALGFPASRSSGKPTRRAGPDFLCIGASRAGTTWLHGCLADHPQLWLPPVKELRFFDKIALHDRRRTPMIIRDDHSRRRAGRYLGRQFRLMRRGCLPQDLAWAFRYFLLPPSEQWYLSLFPTGARRSGECSPTYARLPARTIEHVKKLLPDTKLIYLCRNPVHRDWSLAAQRLHLGQGVTIDDAADSAIMSILGRIAKGGSSNYLDHLDRWGKYYPSHRIFVGFLEEIQQDPEGVLLRLFDFLEVEPSRKHIQTNAHDKVGAQRYGPIPERYARMLSERYYEQVIRMHERFKNAHTQGWLDYVAQRAGTR